MVKGLLSLPIIILLALTALTVYMLTVTLPIGEEGDEVTLCGEYPFIEESYSLSTPGMVPASIFLEKQDYRPGETVEVTIVNLGALDLTVGSDYQICYYDGESWIVVEGLQPEFIPAVSYLLTPGDVYSFEFSLPEGVEEGVYKVRKLVIVEEAGVEAVLEVEFRVSP